MRLEYQRLTDAETASIGPPPSYKSTWPAAGRADSVSSAHNEPDGVEQHKQVLQDAEQRYSEEHLDKQQQTSEHPCAHGHDRRPTLHAVLLRLVCPISLIAYAAGVGRRCRRCGSSGGDSQAPRMGSCASRCGRPGMGRGPGFRLGQHGWGHSEQPVLVVNVGGGGCGRRGRRSCGPGW